MERSELPFSLMRFESKVRCHDIFKAWATHVLSQPDMPGFLEELGILRSIQNAMHEDVERSQVDLSFLVSRWSSHSHTFVAAWGEFSPSLEDVVMLTNLPLFGHTLVVDALDGEGEQLVEDLRASMADAKYVTNKLTYLTWARYFKDGPGVTSPCHLAAFFAYWLSFFVFPSPPEDNLHNFVFPMAALLAQRKQVALGAWFLGSLYGRLDECAHNMARSVGRYDVVSYVEANFLQMFLWERFPHLAPRPLEFDPVPSTVVDGVMKMQTSRLVGRSRRWFGTVWPEVPRRTLREVVDEEASFVFRPYSHTPAGVLPNLMYASRRSLLTPLQPRSSVSVALRILVAVLAPTSLPSRSENGDVLVQYNPHRFVRQFGLDQGAVVETGNICPGLREAEYQYTRVGRDTLLSGYTSVYWPGLLRRGCVLRAAHFTGPGAWPRLRTSWVRTAMFPVRSPCPCPYTSETCTFVLAGVQGTR